MTEAQWLAGDDVRELLAHLAGGAEPTWDVLFDTLGIRKFVLFGVACGRRLWRRVTDRATRALVDRAEQFVDGLATEEELAGQSELIREIFGNTFCPSPPLPPTVLAWNDGTVRRIAEGIYDERAFGRLPILADALLDAGCDDEELMQHCRSAGPHVRGCWVIDLLLGKHEIALRGGEPRTE